MTKDVMRLAALAAVLLAGSCAAPGENDPIPSVDPVVTHPITVQPDYQAVRISFAGPHSEVMADDSAKLERVVNDYLVRGDGSLSISAPEGPDSSAAITYFGERLAKMGVPRSHILVGTHPVSDGDRRVEVGFVAYVAHTEPCGDWSQDAAEDTSANLPMPNFGCAVQHNIAAMVANPRDLDESRRLDEPDAARRATVLSHYEKGEVTQADKRTVDKQTEQSGVSSDIQ